MTSIALARWQNERFLQLDEVENAHQAIGGQGPGRRYETQQLNHAFVLLLAAQFQGFCRDLHGEIVDFAANAVGGPGGLILKEELTKDRKLDRGNANPASLGADFGRLKVLFWNSVHSLDRRNELRQDRLEQLNIWRNAIAHQDFDPEKLGRASKDTSLQLAEVRRWREACNQLAIHFDEAVGAKLATDFGKTPW